MRFASRAGQGSAVDQGKDVREVAVFLRLRAQVDFEFRGCDPAAFGFSTS